MSKTSVGEVYAKVISEVCELSRVDFEEGGTELATLDLLKSEWQKKLSQLKVSQMPWDPTPTPAKQEPVSNNVKPPPQTLPSNGNTGPIQPPANQPPQQTKQESRPYPQQNAPPQPYTVPSYPQGQPITAQQRASMNLHRQFGDRAGAQIAELQQSAQPRAQLPQSLPPNPMYLKQEDTKSNAVLEEFTNDIATQSSVPIKSSQTDGAADWHDEMSKRSQITPDQRIRGDRLMMEHFMSTQQQLEGGGLLLPLDQRHNPVSDLRREVQNLNSLLSSTVPPSSLQRSQGDAAGDDDDEEDENAINSDLDDPDELGGPEQDSENTSQMMLCTWDKVQRVKNKWKCTLKDGILRVEGTDYVFHKGQGEFEW